MGLDDNIHRNTLVNVCLARSRHQRSSRDGSDIRLGASIAQNKVETGDLAWIREAPSGTFAPSPPQLLPVTTAIRKPISCTRHQLRGKIRLWIIHWRG
jgi:hypothetical protein